MTIKVRSEIVILVAAIFALGFALTSQYVFGFHPCELCIWQRWGYVAVIVFAFLSVIPVQAGIQGRKHKLWMPAFAGMTICLLVVMTIAAFHFGIEQKWWEGFSTCSSSFDSSSLNVLKEQIMGAPVVRCDEATWFFLGLSMAGWNVLYSGFLSIYAIKSLFGRGRAGRSGTAHS